MKKTDKDYSFEAVPETDRKAFLPMLFVMLGFTFFSSSMSVGATLGNGLDLMGFITRKTGLSFDQLGQRTFGKIGSYLTSVVVTITQLGWFGVGVAMLISVIGYFLTERVKSWSLNRNN